MQQRLVFLLVPLKEDHFLVVPVVRASSADDAMKIVDAIREGGVNTVEITMTVPDAIGVMEAVAKKFGDEVLLGAGTVLDAETARASILAGAEFVVSPCFNEDLIRICKEFSDQNKLSIV
jgi:2-dehydro-3-deoxyphosphogluconate aldolase/(4S)-4-hydroxy-2-oxoglutarate aldolase